MIQDLVAWDLEHNWHPCAQMKDYEIFKPMVLRSAQGSWIELEDGRRLIDGISSWWSKSLGHGHPRLRRALLEQVEKFEHVMFAHTTHQVIVELSERLASLSPGLSRINYSSDGSCAVEVAIKMSLHAQQLLGRPQRTEFMSLENAYHGETCAALAMTSVERFRKPYQSLLPNVHYLEGIPYVSGISDHLWNDCGEIWPMIEQQLNPLSERLSAILVEPIVQGAAGMLIYSADFLKRLRAWTEAHGIHLIADEIMTGIGRTGLPLASYYGDIQPDFLCLGKGLTSGWLPMSVMLTRDSIYQLFYDDYENGKSFLHSHTFSGNALAAAVALECLKVMDDEKIYAKVQEDQAYLQSLFQAVADETGELENIRGIGAIVAGDLKVRNPGERRGFSFYQKAAELGAIIRPLGNTLYWAPPLNTDRETLQKLQSITLKALQTL